MTMNLQYGKYALRQEVLADGSCIMHLSMPGPDIESTIASAQLQLDAAVKRLLPTVRNHAFVRWYWDIRAKSKSIDAAVPKLKLDEDQLALDYRRAVASLSGEPLAQALADINARRRDIASRLAACDEGKKALAKEVANVREMARREIEDVFTAALPGLQAEAFEHARKTHGEVSAMAAEAAEPLLQLINAHAVAMYVQERITERARHDVWLSQLTRVLDEAGPPPLAPQPSVPVPVAQQPEPVPEQAAEQPGPTPEPDQAAVLEPAPEAPAQEMTTDEPATAQEPEPEPAPEQPEAATDETAPGSPVQEPSAQESPAEVPAPEPEQEQEPQVSVTVQEQEQQPAPAPEAVQEELPAPEPEPVEATPATRRPPREQGDVRPQGDLRPRPPRLRRIHN